jgi:hypothetical protein
VPKFAFTATVPFLRIRKPQNPYLTRVIRNLKAKSQHQLDKMDMLEEEIRWAAKEDQWDRQVDGTLAHSRDGARWEDQLQVVLRQTKQKRKEDQIKSAKRAKLLVELMDKEKELLVQERKRERKSSQLRGRGDSLTAENAVDS